MKNLLFILLLLSPLFAKAQPGMFMFNNDSAKVKINLPVQARDAEYLANFVSHQEQYEDLYDAMKAKFRVANPPANTANIAIDSIEIRTWLFVAQVLRRDHIALQAGVFSRLDALLKSKNNVYLTKQLNDALAYDTSIYTDARTNGRRRLRGLKQ